MKFLTVGAAFAALCVTGCCAYRGVNQVSLVHVREVVVAESAAASTNGMVEVCTNGLRVTTGRIVVVAENVYVSTGGGSAASNDVSGELSLPLVK